MSALLLTSSPATSSTHGAPSGPFARLKLSSTPVLGNALPGAVTVMIAVCTSCPPWPSLTVSCAVNVPGVEYVWVAVMPESLPPSPNSQA